MRIAKNSLSASSLFRRLAICALVFSIVFFPSLSVFAEESTTQETTQETTITPEPEVQTETPVVNEETENQTPEENVPAAPPGPQSPQSPAVDPDPLPPQDSKGMLSPEIDNLTGAFVHTYKIQVPPGRNDMTPDLSLMYNSSNQVNDSIVGYGWSVNIPYIERVNRTGTEDLYTTGDVFSSSLSGELVPLGSNLYAPRSEKGDFLRYERVSSGWIVTDKKGTAYKFGTTSQARQDNSSDIYKWMLEETRDTNDNFIRYEYTKSAGQIYPSKIFYTGTGTTDGIFEIDFTLGSRSDVITTYNPAFSVAPVSVITSIVAKINGSNTRKYDLTYVAGHNQNRSLLSSITETGYDESGTPTALPVMTFDYQTVNDQWSLASWTMPIYPDLRQVGFHTSTQLTDVNGDGLPDFVYALNNNTSTTNPNALWLNTGSGWSLTTWTFPVYPDLRQVGFHTNTRLVDVNGDGLPDWVYAVNNNTSTTNPNAVWLNTGSGWSLTTWTMPVYPDLRQVGFGSSTDLIDVNGDGLPDFVYALNNNTSTTNPNALWLNNGSGWSLTTWTFPVYPDLRQVGFSTSSVQLVDINGDLLPDWIYGLNNNTSTTNPNAVWLNNGSGWTSATWTFPVYPDLRQVGFAYSTQLVDINGDGLLDFIYALNNNTSTASPNDVWLNNGNGWSDATWTMPVYPDLREVGINSSTLLTDVSGDGLPDWIYALNNNTSTANPNAVWINTGEGWSLGTWTMPIYPDLRQVGFTSTTQLTDLNDDGLPDFIYALNNNTSTTNPNAVWLNTGDKSDYLSTITSPQGGSMSITYKEQAIDDKNPITRSPSQSTTVVKDITTNDAFGTTGTKQYAYQDGKYRYYSDGHRNLAGFNIVTTTDEAGNVTKTFYHQGNSTDTSNGEYNDIPAKIGQPYRVEEYDNSNHLYRLTVNRWDSYNIGTDHDFVKLARQTVLTYDGNSSHNDIATEYTYDNTNGSMLTKTEWGKVTAVASDGSFTDTGSDKRITTNDYAINTTTRVIVPKISTVTDASATKVKESKYYYDTLAYGSVNKGNQTKVEDWKVSTTYINSQKAYNSYGLVTSDTDPRGKVTSYSYDTYNLYPTTVTDPLSHTTQYVYDYSLGKPKQVTDQNSFVYQTVYDGLDRVLTEKIPDFTTPYSAVTKTAYAYTDTSGAVKVQRTDYLDGSVTADTYQYFDGLGRLIQDRKEAETSNTFNVSDKAYDARGKVLKESLRYASTGTARTSPTTTTALYTTYAYDPLGRVLTATNAVGSTTNAYDDWMTSTTDANSKVKRYYNDAYNNLIKVEEVNGSSTYTTNYEYNLNDKLTKITDALSNIRNFTYDGLDRRLTAQDLHASTDTTFGTWTYTYDDAGNITQTVSPNALTTNYNYNDVNQVLTEDTTGTTGTDITYAYGSCTNGVGKLCTVTMLTGANTAYTYDSNGNIATDVKTINSVGYTTSTSYDRQKNISVITYPDSASTKYTYNTAGLLEKIEQKEAATRNYGGLITNFDYSPMDQVATQADVNGVTTTNTYDASHLYRLTRRLTQNTSSVKHQDFNYTYDNVGNLTQIVDASNTTAAKTANYGYDDLYRMTSATITLTANSANYTHNFTYDALGNILTGPIGTYLYQGNTSTLTANPHAATSINSVTYTYDADGNLTNNGTPFTWNYRDQMTQSGTGSTSVSYWYDHEGNRVRYQAASGTDISYPNKYYNAGGNKKTKQIYAGATLVATIETITTPTVTVTPYYVHTDTVGSTTAVSDGIGALVTTSDYYPYGDARISSGSFVEQRKYVGQIHDNDTGLDYLNARYYKANVGKFLSEDPVFLTIGDEKPTKALSGKDMSAILSDPQSMNSYSYGRNNPITMSDASGKFAGELIFAAAYIAMNAPQITSFLQSLTTPIGQYSLSQAAVDAKQGNYPMAILGAATAGEISVGKTLVNGVETTADVASFLNKGNTATDVYQGIDKGKDVYVGISKNTALRETQHGARFSDGLRKMTTLPTTNQARAIEQAIIDNKGNSYQNIRNSISSKNPSFSGIKSWANEFMQKTGISGIAE